MKCPKCGMTLPDDSDFCQYCGEKIEQPQSIPDSPMEATKKKCPKCGRTLPDDSDFCQFCGEKIVNQPITYCEQPSPAPEQPNRVSEPADESAAPVLSMLANNMVENILANRKISKNHTSDSDYGLVPEKPIFTFMVDGAQSYLNGLVSENNEELTWHRKGSMPVKGISGPVDIYVSKKKNGEQYKTLYVSIYAEANSQSVPRGFIRKGAAPKVPQSTGVTGQGDISKKGKKRSPLRIALIILAIVSILTLSVLNVIQLVMHNKDQERISAAERSNKELTDKIAELDENNSTKIEELNATIASKDATIAQKDKKIQSQEKTISSQEKTISSQKNKISSLETKANYYSTISSALKSGNIGYAASNFNCAQSIILVKKGETKRVTLTANWSNGGTVSLSYSAYGIANVDFDQNNWSYSTTLSIKGLSAGVNVVTFSNNVDSRTFKIIIIVE